MDAKSYNNTESNVSDNYWDNEIQYQLTMSVVRRMKNNGIISDNEYINIDAIMLKKYRPVVSTLLAGKPLIY